LVHAGNARCPAWNHAAASSALSELGTSIDLLVFKHWVESRGSHREVLSCLNTTWLPSLRFGHYLPTYSKQSGMKALYFCVSVCYTPRSLFELKRLAEQTGLPSTVAHYASKD